MKRKGKKTNQEINVSEYDGFNNRRKQQHKRPETEKVTDVVVFTVAKYKKIKQNLLAHAGFEPATFALLARRSNQLS